MTKKEDKLVKTTTTTDNVKSKINDTTSRGPKDELKFFYKVREFIKDYLNT